MKTVLVSLMAAATLPLFAQKDASIRIYPEQGNQQISKHIYSTASSPNTSGPVSMAGFGSAPNPKYPIHKAIGTTC